LFHKFLIGMRRPAIKGRLELARMDQGAGGYLLKVLMIFPLASDLYTMTFRLPLS
jgi:hypothetical protein